jgi:hypothetical protein
MIKKYKREHKRELKKLLENVPCDHVRSDILELFSDLQERRNYYRDALVTSRAKAKLLQDTIKGTVRDLDMSTRYVMTKISTKDECAIYFDKLALRFSVADAPLDDPHTSFELMGVYSAPYDRGSIRGDIKHVFESATFVGKQ